jgi:WD40 repeat protein
VATASDDSTVQLWKFNGQFVRTFKGHINAVWGVAFSLDGQKLISASEDGTVKLWKLDANNTSKAVDGTQLQLGARLLAA